MSGGMVVLVPIRSLSGGKTRLAGALTPARAPEPAGISEAASSAAAKRPASRRNIQKYASR